MMAPESLTDVPSDCPIDLSREGLATALQIARRAVVSDIESECASVHADGLRWYDTRPMLSEHEHAPPVIEMARQALDFALEWGVIARHSSLPHLVRVLAEGG